MSLLSPTDLLPYDPFDGMRFGPETCFLSGQPVGPTDTIPVFADWLQARYRLADRRCVARRTAKLTLRFAFPVPARRKFSAVDGGCEP